MATKLNTARMLACLLLLACMLAAVPGVKGAISCGSVVASLTPCVSYLISGGSVPPNCCAGLKSVNSSAKTTQDRQAVCTCIKNASKGISGLNPGRIQGLPSSCGVKIPYQFSPTTDCSKVP